MVEYKAEDLVLPSHVFADVTNERPITREELISLIAPISRAHNEDDTL